MTKKSEKKPENIEENIKPEEKPSAPETSVSEEIEASKKALEEERARSEANLAGWQRAQADFINFKRRTEQEKADTCKFTRAEVAASLLPVLDDLDLALKNIPEELVENAWVNGVKLIGRRLMSILEGQGLSCIECVGTPFDPNVHEAVARVSGEEGIVVNELKKGYKFGDRVIRPSAVIVGNGEAVETKKEEE